MLFTPGYTQCDHSHHRNSRTEVKYIPGMNYDQATPTPPAVNTSACNAYKCFLRRRHVTIVCFPSTVKAVDNHIDLGY